MIFMSSFEVPEGFDCSIFVENCKCLCNNTKAEIPTYTDKTLDFGDNLRLNLTFRLVGASVGACGRATGGTMGATGGTGGMSLDEIDERTCMGEDCFPA